MGYGLAKLIWCLTDLRSLFSTESLPRAMLILNDSRRLLKGCGSVSQTQFLKEYLLRGCEMEMRSLFSTVSLPRGYDLEKLIWNEMAFLPMDCDLVKQISFYSEYPHWGCDSVRQIQSLTGCPRSDCDSVRLTLSLTEFLPMDYGLAMLTRFGWASLHLGCETVKPIQFCLVSLRSDYDLVMPT